MKKVLISVIILTIITLMTAGTIVLSQADTDAVLAECQKIMELHKTYYEKLQMFGNGPLTYSEDVEEIKGVMEKADAVEKEVRPVLGPVMESFSKKYGTNSMDVYNNVFATGIDMNQLDGDIGNRFRDLYEGLENIDKSRKATAEHLLNNPIKRLIETSEECFYQPELRIENMETAKALLQLAHKLDPASKEVNKLLGEIDQRIAAVSENIQKDIDSKTWAGNISNFAGPGTVSEMVQASMECLKKDPSWGGKSEILAVAVRGQWDVAETDIFGQPISWRIPVHVAITNEKYKADNIAYVYELSMVTPIGSGKTPPFDGAWVGDSWMMRLNKLP